jgi:hypothetical protein
VEVYQRRALQNAENNDIRRVKSLIRTQLERKLTEEEDKWFRSELSARGKKYSMRVRESRAPKWSNSDLSGPETILPTSILELEVWPSVWFFLERIAEAHHEKLFFEYRIKDLVEMFPVWEHWGKDIRGLGEMNFANLIAESGDLWRYENPAKLWKRMGVGIVAGHGIQRKAKDKEKAKLFGYSPYRRSVVFNLSESLMKGNKDEYKARYDARKEYEMTKPEVKVKAHAHKRSLRFIGKYFLKSIWKEWRVHCP